MIIIIIFFKNVKMILKAFLPPFWTFRIKNYISMNSCPTEKCFQMMKVCFSPRLVDPFFHVRDEVERVLGMELVCFEAGNERLADFLTSEFED